jgi:hypothetical protein
MDKDIALCFKLSVRQYFVATICNHMTRQFALSNSLVSYSVATKFKVVKFRLGIDHGQIKIRLEILVCDSRLILADSHWSGGETGGRSRGSAEISLLSQTKKYIHHAETSRLAGKTIIFSEHEVFEVVVMVTR